MTEQKTIETTSGAEESRRSSTRDDLTRSIMSAPVERVEAAVSCRNQDVVAIEEPLQIRLDYEFESDRVERDVVITMRTPGHGVDLATGFLFSEGILQSADQIFRIRHTDRAHSTDGNRISVTIDLVPSLGENAPDAKSLYAVARQVAARVGVAELSANRSLVQIL